MKELFQFTVVKYSLNKSLYTCTRKPSSSSSSLLFITVKTIRLNIQYTISSKFLQTIELTVIAFTKMNVEISKINKINL